MSHRPTQRDEFPYQIKKGTQQDEFPHQMKKEEEDSIKHVRLIITKQEGGRYYGHIILSIHSIIIMDIDTHI